jgi:hypothetical protein
MALGARRADVLKLVIRMGARPVVLGLVIGRALPPACPGSIGA